MTAGMGGQFVPSSTELGDRAREGLSASRWPSRRKRGRRGNRAAYAYILAAFAYLVLFVLYPMGKAIWLSLTSTDLLTPASNQFIGLSNYQSLLQAGTIDHALVVTAIFTVAVTTGSMLAGVASSLLVETLVAGKATVRTLLALPWAIPPVVIALLFTVVFDLRIGVINRLLALVGLSPVGWLTNDTLALGTVVAVTVWNLFPFVMLVTIAALQTIPTELFDAAAVDGAGRWDMARHISLPFIAPTLQIIALFVVIWSFQQFQIIWLMTQGGPIDGTNLLSIELYRTAFLNDNLGRAAAIGVIGLVPALAVTLLYFRVANPLGRPA